MHGYAGSGKTATSAEFAHWYALTGGVDGPILFTSFERAKSLPRVLDAIGDVFGHFLAQQGVEWLASSDADRYKITLQLLEQIGVLWIWDNIETVDGLSEAPDGRLEDHQKVELRRFLSDAARGKAKFLLTSRRREQNWLEDLPTRIELPPMPMQERCELARAVATMRSYRLTNVTDWLPLLRFTDGNPLALIVLVSEAIHSRFLTHAQLEDFVRRLREGVAELRELPGEDRTSPLVAALNYGFASAFNDTERKQLALLYYFQGFLNGTVLDAMYSPNAEPELSEIVGSNRTPTDALLARAADLGLLSAQRDGRFLLHPALPIFLNRLFDDYYGPVSEVAARAFVRAMSTVAGVYVESWSRGSEGVVEWLAAERNNFVRARKLALRHGWRDWAVDIMQGLCLLYRPDQRGVDSEWDQLVRELVAEFVDPQTDGPRPGSRSESWFMVMQYRVDLAKFERDYGEARRLLQICLAWARERTQAILNSGAELNETQRYDVRNLALMFEKLADIQREADDPVYLESVREALLLSERIGDMTRASACALILAGAAMHSSTPNLDEAELWARRSLDWRNESDVSGRARCMAQLGLITYERFREARSSEQPIAQQLGYVNSAICELHRALSHFPEEALHDRALTCLHIGTIYANAGINVEALRAEALRNAREAIRLYETMNDDLGAGQAKLKVAEFLKRIGSTQDALSYARSAHRQLARCGSTGSQWERAASELVSEIAAAADEPTSEGGEANEDALPDGSAVPPA